MLYAFQLFGGVYKRVEVPAPEQSSSLKFGDWSDFPVGSLVADRDYKLHYAVKSGNQRLIQSMCWVAGTWR